MFDYRWSLRVDFLALDGLNRLEFVLNIVLDADQVRYIAYAARYDNEDDMPHQGRLRPRGSDPKALFLAFCSSLDAVHFIDRYLINFRTLTIFFPALCLDRHPSRPRVDRETFCHCAMIKPGNECTVTFRMGDTDIPEAVKELSEYRKKVMDLQEYLDESAMFHFTDIDQDFNTAHNWHPYAVQNGYNAGELHRASPIIFSMMAAGDSSAF